VNSRENTKVVNMRKGDFDYLIIKYVKHYKITPTIFRNHIHAVQYNYI